MSTKGMKWKGRNEDGNVVREYRGFIIETTEDREPKNPIVGWPSGETIRKNFRVFDPAGEYVDTAGSLYDARGTVDYYADHPDKRYPPKRRPWF